MKKINLFILCFVSIQTLFITSCSSESNQKSDDFVNKPTNSGVIYQQTRPNVNENVAQHTYLFEKECNGHIYVICTGSGTQSGVFMMHSPNCPCLKEKNYE